MKPAGLIAGIAAMLFAVTALPGGTRSSFDFKLAKDRQAVHALNRLAFGPRPGDVEAVGRLGVEAWIRQQLNPAGVPENAETEARLQPLASIRMPTWQLLETAQQQPLPLLPRISPPPLAEVLPADQIVKLLTNTTPVDVRRTMLAAIPAATRSQVLSALPPQVFEGLPEIQMEATRARVQPNAMALQSALEQLRRLRPNLKDLLDTEDALKLQMGTEQEKAAVIAKLTPEQRGPVFRALGAAAVPALPLALRREALAASNPPQAIVNELIEAKLQRAVHSNRQLEEVLVDFWFNHFNVSTTKGQVRPLLTSYERDAIRPHVLGRFRDLLLATARHPAMLFYLDNFQSQVPRTESQPLAAPLPAGIAVSAPGINENYGRELMELHTLGVGSGYTQDDVVSMARIFTGWSIYDLNRVGEFQFNPVFHDRNEKKLLGRTFPRGGGEDEGVQAIEMLAKHPATARLISRKLAQRFVADDPPQSLLDRMAATFTKTDGDLRAVMETMLLSREFMSEGAWQAKVKSPLEMVVSSLRALDAEVTDTMMIAQRIAELGQPLYAKMEPTGYPNTGETWAGSAALLGRMNFANALLAGQISGVRVSPAAIAAASTRKTMVELAGAEAAERVAALLQRNADGHPLAPELVAAVLIGSPDFQKR
jgi:uncharacterized protein (DUF1800 family)